MKTKVARAVGIPTTKQGLERKIGGAILKGLTGKKSVGLFKDNDRYKDDVYVAVNGQNCIIKRGEWVRIKRKFALVLDASEIQDMKTAEFIEREQKRFVEGL